MKRCLADLHYYAGKRCGECAAIWRRANRARLSASDSERRRVNAVKVSEREKEYRKTHREEKRAYNSRYYLANSARFAEYYLANRDRERARNSAWYQSNPEVNREKSNRRRASRIGVGSEPVTREHLKLLFDAQDGCCRYCRTPLGTDKHLDHRIPLARGGTHAPSNVCWSCPRCNLQKRTKSETEFISWLGAA